jgi:hypothetical protein
MLAAISPAPRTGKGGPKCRESPASNRESRAISSWRPLFAAHLRLRHSGCVDHDAPSPDQLEAIRRLTPEERYRASRELYWTLRRHKAAFLRSLHADWSEEEVEAEVRRIFRDART